jgi:hypothetical protein
MTATQMNGCPPRAGVPGARPQQPTMFLPRQRKTCTPVGQSPGETPVELSVEDVS